MVPLNRFDLVLQEVGEFGLYQKRLLFLMALTTGCVLFHNFSPVFTMKIPRHRCRVPGLQNDTYRIQDPHHALLVNDSVPLDSDGHFSQCSLYAHHPHSENGSTTANRSLVACDQWVFDQSVFKSTYVSELNLVCHRIPLRAHSTMMVFAGKFVGAFCNSAGGDYFGRRRLYLVMAVGLTATALGLIFVPSLPVLMLLRFLDGATTTGCYLPAYVICIELLGVSHRPKVGMVSSASQIVANLLGVLLFFLLRDWQLFQVCQLLPCLAMLAGYRYLPESPRWLASRGRMEEAQKVMEQVARTNGTSSPVHLAMTANGWQGDSSQGDSCQGETVRAASVTPLDLFRHLPLLLRYSLLYCCWILLIMCTYGLNLNVTNMSGDLFLNFTLMTGADVVAWLIFMLVIERVGRRTLSLAMSLLGGLACGSALIPSLLGASDWILRGLSFAGRMCVSVALSAIYVLSPELFPTVTRSFGLGSCSMMSRIGGLASPYVADLSLYVDGWVGQALPQLVFGLAGLLTAAMLCCLPETKGRPLPETVKDALRFARSNVRDNGTGGDASAGTGHDHRC